LNQPTPAIVTQGAVRRLPRLALLLLCAAYVVPGFVGREPWKNADIMALGYMVELAEGRADWLNPTLLGQPPEFDALLPYWLGAWAMQLAPAWVAPDFAARLPFVALLVLTLLATWYAVFSLARSPRAQPLAFAFGGEAQPRDYARAVADGGLLALIACLGLLQLSHETTPSLAQLGFTALTFYGLAALPYAVPLPALSLAVGLLGLGLSGAPAMAVLFALGGALVTVADREAGDAAARQRAAVVIAVLALATAAIAAAFDTWHWRLGPAPGPGRDWTSISRLLLWFTWPAWPLALWTLWQWRRQLASRHVALPAWFAAVALTTALLSSPSDRALLLALPALAALAAFALPTFRRSVSALIDWFTLLFFSGCAIIIWVIWISLQTGVPAKPAANVAKLAPGFVPEFGLLPFLVALAATLAWFWLVYWRTSRSRQAIWKSLVLPAGGAALGWLLVMTLWLPVLDYARSYVPVVNAIVRHIDRPGCVETIGLTRAQLAALRVHGQLDVRAAGLPSACGWLVAAPDMQLALPMVLDPRRWQLVTTARRPTDARDNLLLFRKSGS
jgi:4-amino-4-deoxy-L-arabinose transferase-like glycosyltransferase